MEARLQLSVTCADIQERIITFQQSGHPLLGISNPDELSYISTLIASVANELTELAEADWSLTKLGGTDLFDPLKTAAGHHMRQETDEACWLIFLSCHVGRHPKHGWNLVNAMYSGPDGGEAWTWEKVSGNSKAFEHWLLDNYIELGKRGSMGGAHKYVSLDYHGAAGLVKDIASYVAWVGSHVDHDQLIGNGLIMGNGDPAAVFDYLYRSMNERIRARKSIKFSYLSLLGSIGVANIEADHPYLNDLFFSKKGARWLFGGEMLQKIPIGELNGMVISLSQYLELPNGMFVLYGAFEQLARKRHHLDVQKFKMRHNR